MNIDIEQKIRYELIATMQVRVNEASSEDENYKSYLEGRISGLESVLKTIKEDEDQEKQVRSIQDENGMEGEPI